MTRNDYMNGTVSHDTYYNALADVIGRDALKRLVGYIATPALIAECLQTDENLNNIPLIKWDRMDGAVRDLIAHRAGGTAPVMAVSWSGAPLKPKTFCWSLSESVCVLKAVARRMATSQEVSA